MKCWIIFCSGIALEFIICCFHSGNIHGGKCKIQSMKAKCMRWWCYFGVVPCAAFQDRSALLANHVLCPWQRLSDVCIIREIKRKQRCGLSLIGQPEEQVYITLFKQSFLFFKTTVVQTQQLYDESAGVHWHQCSQYIYIHVHLHYY